MKWLFTILLFYSVLATPLQGAPLKTEQATFAGGCFWCMQKAFDNVPGVLATTVGYTGGEVDSPNYHQVSAGGTGHAESLRVEFDPAVISYKDLLDVFWHNIDPTVKNRQFCDVGSQYRSEIFYHDETQKKLAEQSKQMLLDKKVVDKIETKISALKKFYLAEDYHQKYYQKNPLRYAFYTKGCGRKKRLQQLWQE